MNKLKTLANVFLNITFPIMHKKQQYFAIIGWM